MTNARKRYEAKTRVVTFRVDQEVYEQIEEIRKLEGLSFADLIKLGAGIAREEIDKKLNEVSRLQAQLVDLRKSIFNEQRKLDKLIENARKEKLDKLEREMQAFHLFDTGWSTDEVRSKLGISKDTVFQQYKEWAELRDEREKLQIELFKKYLRKQIANLREYIYYRATGRDLEESKKRLEYCRHMLIDPSKLSEEDKIFLISEHSDFI
jgi:hypothetical protein